MKVDNDTPNDDVTHAVITPMHGAFLSVTLDQPGSLFAFDGDEVENGHLAFADLLIAQAMVMQDARETAADEPSILAQVEQLTWKAEQERVPGPADAEPTFRTVWVLNGPAIDWSAAQ